MSPRRKKRLLIVSASLLAVASFVGLLVFAFENTIDLFYTPSELAQGKGNAKLKPKLGQRLRIGGLVEYGSIKRASDSLKVNFDVGDASGAIVKVEYTGVLPGLFKEGQGVVAHGILRSENEVEAFEILAKHDENYMPQEVADVLQARNYVEPSQRELK